MGWTAADSWIGFAKTCFPSDFERYGDNNEETVRRQDWWGRRLKSGRRCRAPSRLKRNLFICIGGWWLGDRLTAEKWIVCVWLFILCWIYWARPITRPDWIIGWYYCSTEIPNKVCLDANTELIIQIVYAVNIHLILYICITIDLRNPVWVRL